jgi:flagellin
MSLVVRTNTASIFAVRALTVNQRSSATAMERLSTGLRINAAKDDAAGMAIANRMTSSIKGLAQAIKNINDGINLLQTADNSFETLSDITQRLRELAVQASNDTYSQQDRAYLQAEATSLQNEMYAIVDRTSWNNHVLLNGSFVNKNIQMGVGSDHGSRMNVDIIGLSPVDLSMSQSNEKNYGQFVLQINYAGLTPKVINARLNEDTGDLLTSIDPDWASGSSITANTSFRLEDFVYGGNDDENKGKGQGHITINPSGIGPNEVIFIEYTGDVFPNNAVFINFEYVNGVYSIKNVGSNSSGVTSISATFGSGLIVSGSPIDKLNISEASSASNSIGRIDNLLRKINENRASIGAFINAMNSHVNNSNMMFLNLSNSRSFVVDANYAQETAELAKTQILQSSASAILVQANSRNDLVRELLKSQ